MPSQNFSFRLTDDIEEQAVCLDLLLGRKQVDGIFSKVIIEALYDYAVKQIEDGERPTTLYDVLQELREIKKIVLTRTLIHKDESSDQQPRQSKRRFSAVASHLENQKR